MADVTYRGNLSASNFPLVSTYQGRSTILAGVDQNYIRGLQASADGLIDDASRGIPQINFAQNVLPSPEGFQSVGFLNRVGLIGLPNDLMKIFPVKDTLTVGQEAACYLTWSKAQNKFYVLTQVAGVWTWGVANVTGVSDFGTALCVSYAVVNGLTYILIYLSAQQCRVYDPFGNNLNTVVLIGTGAAFPAGAIKGNASCFGYHILWDELTIAWSSTVNPLDFTPSLVTGAGYSKVEGARGQIVAVVSHQLGLIIYTTANAIAAIYTGNARYPFQFKEITGVGGFPDYSPALSSADDLISDDPNTNSQYAYSSSGLQLINSSYISIVQPDITDFLSGNYLEDFDTTTKLFTRTKLTQQLIKKINTVADRYLIVSYGIAELTHALIYDMINKRIGKVKITHVYAFELANTNRINSANTSASTGPKGSLAFMSKTGVIQTVNFDTVDSTAIPPDAVIMLGKFQHSRNEVIGLEAVEAEEVQAGAGCNCYLYTSLDGKNPIGGDDTAVPPVQLTSVTASKNLRTWDCHVIGLNHIVVLIGAFYLSTFQLKYHGAGKR